MATRTHFRTCNLCEAGPFPARPGDAMVRALGPGGLALILAAGLAPGFAQAGEPFVGQGISVARGVDGLALIAYQDVTEQDLKVAHCSNVLCTSATITRLDVADDVGAHSSVAIGSDGLGLIAYYDATFRDLKVAHCVDVACTSASIRRFDSVGQAGRFTSVAIGSDGLPLISYSKDNPPEDIRVAHCRDVTCSGGLIVPVSDVLPGPESAVIVGSDGLPLIAYSTGVGVKTAHCTDLNCLSRTIATADPGVGEDRGKAAIRGADGLGFLAYVDVNDRVVRFAHCNDVACTSTTATAGPAATPSEGVAVGLAVGADGLPLVSYPDASFRLAMAHCSNAACTAHTTSVVDASGQMGEESAIMLGSDGLPLVAYNDRNNGELKVAHCNDAACTTATLSRLDGFQPPVPGVGPYVDLAMGADGLGLISYRDDVQQDLAVAHCRDLDCSTADLSRPDTAGDVGQHNSIAVGADGRGLISYYDATNADLKVAHCADAACTAAALATLDSAGDVGQFSSLAIGPDGRGLIAYHDAGSGTLKVAHCADAACTGATVATVGPGGLFASLAIGADGLGLIAHVRGSQLWVAHCQDAACSTATHTFFGGFLASDATVVIGADGLARVGYFEDFRDLNTRMFHCDDVACTSYAFIGDFFRADETSAVKGVDGGMLMSSYDPFGQDLGVLHCSEPVFCGTVHFTRLDGPGNVGRNSSLVIGPDGAGLIAYPDLSLGLLKVAHCLDVICSAARISVVNGPPVPTRFHTVPPCRLADTRSTHAPALLANELRYFAVGGKCGVALDARAVAMNVTAAQPEGRGNLRVYPVGIATPLASTLNVDAGKNRANLTVVPLGTAGYVVVLYDMPAGSTATTHLILDVFGYFK